MKLRVIDSQLCVGCQSCMFACSRRKGDGGLTNSCIGVRSKSGISAGFVVIVCRSCQDPPCAKACPHKALKKAPGGGVRLIPDKCIGCKSCKKACVINAVYWNEEENKPQICVQCGICVNYCPHGVIELRKDIKQTETEEKEAGRTDQ